MPHGPGESSPGRDTSTGPGGVMPPIGSSNAMSLDLTVQDATTEWLRIPVGKTNAVIDVQPISTATGTAWVAELQYTAEAYTDNEQARSFSPAVVFNNTTPNIMRTGLPSGAFIRVKTTTPDGNSDAVAPVAVVIT